MKRKKLLPILLLLLSSLFIVSCGNGNNNESEDENKAVDTEKENKETETSVEKKDAKGEIYVLAAASLKDVMTELQADFNKNHEDINITYSFDSSGTLQKQIEEGAPSDIFISAGQKQMDALESEDLIDEDSRVDLLKNEVVLIVPKESEKDISSFEDVASDKVDMVAVGEASVPVGQYTEEIYTNLGLWDKVKEKANFGTNVRNVLAWVEEGEVDCGIVYKTDAAISDKVKVVAEAPEDSHKPVIYPAALIKDSTNEEAAKVFFDYLKSDQALKTFESYGFVAN